MSPICGPAFFCLNPRENPEARSLKCPTALTPQATWCEPRNAKKSAVMLQNKYVQIWVPQLRFRVFWGLRCLRMATRDTAWRQASTSGLPNGTVTVMTGPMFPGGMAYHGILSDICLGLPFDYASCFRKVRVLSVYWV